MVRNACRPSYHRRTGRFAARTSSSPRLLRRQTSESFSPRWLLREIATCSLSLQLYRLSLSCYDVEQLIGFPVTALIQSPAAHKGAC